MLWVEVFSFFFSLFIVNCGSLQVYLLRQMAMDAHCVFLVNGFAYCSLQQELDMGKHKPLQAYHIHSCRSSALKSQPTYFNIICLNISFFTLIFIVNPCFHPPTHRCTITLLCNFILEHDHGKVQAAVCMFSETKRIHSVRQWVKNILIGKHFHCVS